MFNCSQGWVMIYSTSLQCSHKNVRVSIWKHFINNWAQGKEKIDSVFSVIFLRSFIYSFNEHLCNIVYVYLCVCVYAHMYMYVMMPEWRSEDDLYEYVWVSTMCISGIEFRLPVLVVSAVAGGAILMAPVMRFFFKSIVKRDWELRKF